MFTSKVVVLLFGLAALAAAKRFCPREKRDGFECRAKQDQFKCGIFFEDLLGGNDIKWIGALPDAIKKTRRTDPLLVEKIFPKVENKVVTEEYFKTFKEKCDKKGEKDANSKCYLVLSQIADDKLDSCKKTVGNLDGTDTIGNQLCGQARRFLAGANKDTTKGLIDQKLSMYKSYCTEPWTPVDSTDKNTKITTNLTVEEKLCCDASWRYYKCGGGDFKKSCS